MRGRYDLNLAKETDNMEDFLRDCGFVPRTDDTNILEATYTEDDSVYIASIFDIRDPYDRLVIQYFIDSDTVLVSVDGVEEYFEPDDLMEALSDD